MKEKFTIQQVAARTGLTVHTLRYYEKIGLLKQVSRGGNGYREYSEQYLSWIEFLIRLREMGMPIQLMIHFAELRYAGDETVSARRELLENLEQEVVETVTRLQQNLGAIRSKIIIYKEWERDGQRDD
jgi:DNA-binding transcriptional MerR regulator